MESSSSSWRRRGLKGKLAMSLYKAPKPSSAQYSSKVIKPTPVPSTASMGFVVVDAFPAPLQPTPPQMKVEKIQVLRAADTRRDVIHLQGNWYAADGDANVDKMAASYISRMQERFRLEQSD